MFYRSSQWDICSSFYSKKCCDIEPNTSPGNHYAEIEHAHEFFFFFNYIFYSSINLEVYCYFKKLFLGSINVCLHDVV